MQFVYIVIKCTRLTKYKYCNNHFRIKKEFCTKYHLLDNKDKFKDINNYKDRESKNYINNYFKNSDYLRINYLDIYNYKTLEYDDEYDKNYYDCKFKKVTR